MRRLRKAMRGFTALMSVGILVACSSGGDTDTEQVSDSKEIEFWTISLQPTFTEYFEEVIDEFEAENEGVTVVWKDYPYDTLKNKLLTSISSNDIPNIVNLNAEMALSMGDKEALSNADEYLTEAQREEFFPGIYAASNYEGKTLAVPWYTTSPVLFINNKILTDAGLDSEDVPKNFEEYIAWAKTIHDKTGKYATTVVPDVRDLLVSNGIDIFNENKTEAIFNTDKSEQFLTIYQELVNDSIASKDATTMDTQVQLFGSGELVSVIAGTPFINALKTTSPDVYENTIAVPVPNERAISSTMFLTVPDKSENKELSYKFIEHITNADEQLEFSKQANTLPSTQSTIEDPFFTETSGSLEDMAKFASSQGLMKATELAIDVDLLDVLNVGMQNIILNDAEVHDEVNQTIKNINQKLK